MIAVEPTPRDTADLTAEMACELLAGYQDDLRRLSDERDQVATAAALPATLLFRLMGKQKSKKLGAFTAYLTYDERRYCTCCRVRVGQCPNPTMTVITDVAPRIYVRRTEENDDRSSI